MYHIFTRIPDRYDLINHVITLGMDNGWRRQTALACLQDRPARILDICCGTGDLAITIAKLAQYTPEITGADYSQPMLEIAAAKASSSAKGKNIRFINADVARLPFSDCYFDCIGISFAFRNLTYNNPLTPTYLNEILRVLKPGGRLLILEVTKPEGRAGGFLFRQYFGRIYPFLTRLFTRSDDARAMMRYYWETMDACVPPAAVLAALNGAGLAGVKRTVILGLFSEYTAVKPAGNAG